VNLLNKDNLRFVYFGDHYMSDVHFSAQVPRWQSIAVIEELGYEDSRLDDGIDPDSVNCSSKWGDYFLSESGHKNYFVSEVARVARYALPYVRNINLMM
jgi:hypothetical protein